MKDTTAQDKARANYCNQLSIEACARLEKARGIVRKPRDPKTGRVIELGSVDCGRHNG